MFSSASYDMCLNTQPPHLPNTGQSLSILSGDGSKIFTTFAKAKFGRTLRIFTSTVSPIAVMGTKNSQTVIAADAAAVKRDIIYL